MAEKDLMNPSSYKTVQSEGSKRKKTTSAKNDPIYKESVKVPPTKVIK